jgi:hypothetical protein
LSLRELLKQNTLGSTWIFLLLLSLALAQHLLPNLKQTHITEVVILAREGTTLSYWTSSLWALRKLASVFQTTESS